MMQEKGKKQRKSTTAPKACHAVPAANESQGDWLAEGEKVCKECLLSGVICKDPGMSS